MSSARPDHDLEQLIAEFQRSGLRELHVRRDGIEIYLSQDADAPGLDAPHVRVDTAAAPHAPANAAPPVTSATGEGAAPASAAAIDMPPNATLVRAPYLGSFYRSPKPGQPPYVELGETVSAETELCLVEVMKLFTAVRAGVAGRIHAILAKDGEMIAADQPLFVIVPE